MRSANRVHSVCEEQIKTNIVFCINLLRLRSSEAITLRTQDDADNSGRTALINSLANSAFFRQQGLFLDSLERLVVRVDDAEELLDAEALNYIFGKDAGQLYFSEQGSSVLDPRIFALHKRAFSGVDLIISRLELGLDRMLNLDPI